jgi:hypothetical protein
MLRVTADVLVIAKQWNWSGVSGGSSRVPQDAVGVDDGADGCRSLSRERACPGGSWQCAEHAGRREGSGRLLERSGGS